MSEKQLTQPELTQDDLNDLAADLSGTQTNKEILETVKEDGVLRGTKTPPTRRIRMPVEKKRKEDNPLR